VPEWQDVERVIREVAKSGRTIYTVTGKPNRIVEYVPGRSVTVETKKGIDDIAIDVIRHHWTTLETKRRVRLRELLDPGRRSAFMGALFSQVPGVRVEGTRPAYLVIEDS
jgi:hypothetical protein